MRFAAAAALVAAAAAASAAPPSPARVNGVPVAGAGPVKLGAGDRLETGDAAVDAAVETAAGSGRAAVAPGSVVVHQGAERGVTYLFVASGSAEGDVGGAFSLGGAASWAVAPEGGTARVRVTASDGAGRDATAFRAARGSAWLRFHGVSTWLPERCDVTLVPAADGPGSLEFRAAAANVADVEVVRASAERSHVVVAAPGAAGTLSVRDGATRVVCRTAPSRGGLLAAEVRRAGRPAVRAAVGPGAELRIDGDRFRVDVPAAGPGALDALLALDAEFAVLGAR